MSRAPVPKAGREVISDLRGGRNGYDPPWALPANQCSDAVNVDWYQTPFAHKRGGAVAVSLTFSAGGPFADHIVTLLRHVPGTDEGAAELWAVDNTGVVGRMAAATTFSAPTFKDAFTGNYYDVCGATINGHLQLAYQSAVARHHVWDGSTVRRAGLAASAAPTAANGGGAGTYAAVARFYRQRSTVQASGITIRRSEPSPSVSFTPDGSHLNATVTQATVINEGETHWEVEASLDNITFYRIATVAIGTTTYADSAATTTYNASPLSALTGVYTLQKPYKYTAADQNRILGFGSYTATDKQSRIEFSAVIGSLDTGDEERVDTTTNYYLDLDENDSGAAIGLNGPILGSYLAFKFREIAQLTPTGVTTAPYTRSFLSKTIGAVTNRSIVQAEDQNGNPALYWMSHRGPYRWGANGLEYIGHGVEDLILGPTSHMYTVAGDNRLAHTVYYQDKRQVWFSILINYTAYYTIVANDGTSGYWHFQEAAGTAADSSGNGFTLTPTGGIGYHAAGALQDGTFGFTFNGTTGFLTGPNNVVLGCNAGPFTCEFFADGASNGLTQYVAGKYDGTVGWFIYFDAAGHLHAGGLGAGGLVVFTLTSAGVYLDSTYRYFVVTWAGAGASGAALKLYVNGVLTDTAANMGGSAAVANSASAFIVGAEPSAMVSGFFNGNLDEVSVYNDTALTGTQVTAHYASSLGFNNRVTLQYDVKTGGWSRFIGTRIQAQLCSVMFANTLGTSMSLDLKPYVSDGIASGTAALYKMDTGTADGADPILANITPRAVEPGTAGFFGECGDAVLLAKAQAGGTVSCVVTPDFGAQVSKTGTASLTPALTEARVSRRLEDSTLSGAQFYQHTVGDVVANTSPWTLERLVIPLNPKEEASS